MLIRKFNLKSEVAELKNSYNSIKRKTDLDFYVLENIIKIITEDFGGEKNKELLRHLHHTFYVVKTIQKILTHENASPENLKMGIVSALLHDTGYLVIKNKFKVFQDFQKSEIRKAHMEAGAKYAEKTLKKINQAKKIFPYNEIKNISFLVSIHDNPSVKEKDFNRILDVKDSLSYSLREADRLWMTSEDGFAYDLMRMKEKTGEESPKKLFDHMLKRYAEEKSLYKDDGKFQGNTLFRSEEAYSIFQGQKNLLVEKYDLKQV